jgi:hypothetical protein
MMSMIPIRYCSDPPMLVELHFFRLLMRFPYRSWCCAGQCKQAYVVEFENSLCFWLEPRATQLTHIWGILTGRVEWSVSKSETLSKSTNEIRRQEQTLRIILNLNLSIPLPAPHQCSSTWLQPQHFQPLL